MDDLGARIVDLESRLAEALARIETLEQQAECRHLDIDHRKIPSVCVDCGKEFRSGAY